MQSDDEGRNERGNSNYQESPNKMVSVSEFADDNKKPRSKARKSVREVNFKRGSQKGEEPATTQVESQ